MAKNEQAGKKAAPGAGKASDPKGAKAAAGKGKAGKKK